MHRQHETNRNVVFFADQFRLFGVHPHYHILIRCWEQVADAIIGNGELLLAIVILNVSYPLSLQCESKNKEERKERKEKDASNSVLIDLQH